MISTPCSLSILPGPLFAVNNRDNAVSPCSGCPEDLNTIERRSARGSDILDQEDVFPPDIADDEVFLTMPFFR